MKQAAAQRRGRSRALWLGGALAATLLAAQWVSGEDGGADLGQPAEDRVPKKGIPFDGKYDKGSGIPKPG